MKTPNTIQLFEYDVLRVGQLGFTKEHFKRFSMYYEKRQPPFFTLGHNTIRFSNFVGVFQVHDLVIEVLPKAGRNNNTELWRNVLVEMLKISGFLKIRLTSHASLRLQGGNLLNLFFDVYLSYCQNIIKEGLARKYQRENYNNTALKGRLIFSEQLKHNLIRKDRFYTNRQEYTTNNIYNRILFKALRILALVTNSAAQRKDAEFLIEHNAIITDINCTQETFRRLNYERSTERYRSAIQLAELIILNYLPELKAGARPMFAILFPMEALFEAYVTQVLLLAARKTPSLEVLPQRSIEFWRTDGRRPKRVKPDIIVKSKEREKQLILDTKWKLPKYIKSPDDGDLKQMFVYNKLFHATSSSLIYPEVQPTGYRKGTFVGGDHGECSMWFIPIIDPENRGLNKNLGTTMLSHIISSL